MASGDLVVKVLSILPTGADPATADVRVGGSTPAENVDVTDFDDTTIEYMDLKCLLEGYSGGGLSFINPWSATTATSGVTRWGIAIRRMQDDVDDIDAAHTYVFNDSNDTAPSASGELSYPTALTFTDGADMDNWADGEIAIVRVRRNASDAADTMSGDAELWGVFGRET